MSEFNVYYDMESTREIATKAYKHRVSTFQGKIRRAFDERAKAGFFFVNVKIDQSERDMLEDEIVRLQSLRYHVVDNGNAITISWTG